jgi:FkbM family methyltransferase
MKNRNSAVYVGDHRVLLKTARGFKMFVDSRDVSIAPHLILDGVWEEGTEAALRQLVRPGMRVAEVGANVGYFTVLMAHAVGQRGSVVAFEPDPSLAQIIRDNIEINGFTARTAIEAKAVADTQGELRFFATHRHRGNGSILPGFEQLPDNPEDARDELVVPCTTLDAYFANDPPDLLKIDAEGAESAVLRGSAGLLAAPALRTIVLEFFPRFVEAAGDEPRAFLERLLARGYRLHRIDHRKRKIRAARIDELLGAEFTELVLRRG